MPYTIKIPKTNKDAELTIKLMLAAGKEKRSPQAIRWWICRWYMRGVRNFKNLNYQEGTIQVSFYDEDGVLNFQYEDIVAKYQAQKGRLMGVNLRPVVTKEGMSLDGMRKASVGQVVLDSVFPAPAVEEVQDEAVTALLNYGTIGLIPWIHDDDKIGIEVVPPWELLPMPVETDSTHKKRGLIRRKLVPLQWIQDLPGVPDKNAKLWKEIETMEVPIGVVHPEGQDRMQGSVVLGGFADATASTINMNNMKPGGSKQQSGNKTKVKVTEAAELWTMTPDNYWAEYILYAGGKIIGREDYTGMKKQFPPQVISDIDIGDFWGRSYVDTLIPLNTEMEEVFGRQFQNLKDIDLFGLMMWPTTSGQNMRVIRAADGTKVAAYEPDIIAPEHKPYNIAPTKSGTLPAQIAKLGMDAQNAIAMQPNQLMGGDAPGRVDSAQGLGFLYETSNVPLTPTSKSLARAFANCYRVALDVTKGRWKDDRILDITHLDDAIAGIQIDPQTGRVQLTDNAIPHPDDVVISVVSAVPRSKEQMKMELKDALKEGRISLTEFNIKARKESLELPVGNEQEWQNHRRATLENIMLFGDGQTPGRVTYSDRDMHYVHLMVLDAFMARPEFYLASPEVRNVFVKHREEHMAGLGQTPEGLPLMDQAAEMNVMSMEGGMPPATF